MKPIWKSKINWVQLGMFVMAVLCDPQLGDVIPVQYLPKIVWAANVATFFLRTFFSGEPLNFRQPPVQGD